MPANKHHGNGHALPPEQSRIARILKEASQNVISQSHRILPDLALLQGLYQTFLAGGVIDDRKYLVEKVVQLVASLPNGSTVRNELSGVFINNLWTTLHHPPISYLGNEFRYRSADGSNNNIMYPQLGAAGSHYARSVTPKHLQPTVRPDPSLMFDTLLARRGPAKNHPAQVSSNLFYLATIIIHDLFITDEKDMTKSRTSSYLDLGPLYGNNKEEQRLIRTFRDGMLKKDAFSEHRLLGQPPGVCALIIAFNRFHNYIVQELAVINENERFSIPAGMNKEGEAYAKALELRDEALFQTGRLVTCGLYVNIILNDYLRTILNLNRNPINSDWKLDPRESIPNVFDPQGTPRGVGNQVSVEFNMIYRWHSAISDNDEAWANDFFAEVFGPGVDPSTLSVPQFLGQLHKWLEGHSKDPGEWTFANLKRNDDGSFEDEPLVRLLQVGAENVAGAYGARNVPKVMKVIEMLGIQQGRHWGLATLNEFREFSKLKPYSTFEEINSDKSVSDALKALYGHPDNIELYPGILVEDAKEPMAPGSGLCPNYTISFAILSDAVALVRGDRFYSADYGPSTLTNFGLAAAESDFDVAEGGVMYKLLMQAFPGWYRGNSVQALYPFTTVEANRQILKKRGTVGNFDFDFDVPSFAGPPKIVRSWQGVVDVLCDQERFELPWGERTFGVAQEKRGDSAPGAPQRAVLRECLHIPADGLGEVRKFYESAMTSLLRQNSRKLGDFYQVDIVAEVGNIANANFASQFFGIPLKDSGAGDHTDAELHCVLADLFRHVFLDLDETKSAKHRAVANREVKRLGQAMKAAAEAAKGQRFAGIRSMFGMGKSESPIAEYGRQLVGKLLGVSKDVDEAVWAVIPTAAAACVTQAQGWARMIDLYLSDEYKHHWKDIQVLAQSDAPADFDKLKRYALEGLRLAPPVSGVTRTVKAQTGPQKDTQKPMPTRKGHTVLASLATAGRDPAKFPDPAKVRFDRPDDAYAHQGWGPHASLGRPMAVTAAASGLRACARLGQLRRAPGTGEMRSRTTRGGSFEEFLSVDGTEWGPFPCSKQVVFDNFGD